MMAQSRKARFIRLDFGEPGIEVVAQHVLVEEFVEVEAAGLHHLGHVVERPDRQRIVVGDEAQRRGARARSSRRVSSMPSVWCASRPSNG